jgi:hypothetical protein
VGSNPFPQVKTNFGPRAGFAYQINNRVVLRGGFGEYFSDPTNDWFQTNGFSTSTTLVNSNDGNRTALQNILGNPYPNGILVPTGSSAGAATFVGRNPSWFQQGFQTPSVWQFSLGFQVQVHSNGSLDVSYVGSRSYNLNMQADYNIPSLQVRKMCNYLEGGNAALCNTQVPNPFKGIPAFSGTNDFTANTISFWRLMTPFPQFGNGSGGQNFAGAGTTTQFGRNDSYIKYNSLQINYNQRLRGGLTILANYTLSKQIEEWGLNDPYTKTYQQGPYTLDRPQVLKVSTIYQLPFGKGKKFGSNSHGFVDRLISGWEYSQFFLDPFSGFPANLPSNAIILKDPAKTPGGGYTGSVDWKAYQVREFNPCVLKQDPNTGAIAPTAASIGLGCGADFSNNWGNYAWLETTTFAPRFTPFRSGQIRVHHAFQWDMSLLKTTRINERMRFQAGFEAFNVFNHNYFGRDNLQTNPENANFGSVIPSTVSTQNILPRQIQVRFKFYW